MIKIKGIVNFTLLKVTKQKLCHDLDNLKNHTDIKNSYKWFVYTLRYQPYITLLSDEVNSDE